MEVFGELYGYGLASNDWLLHANEMHGGSKVTDWPQMTAPGANGNAPR